MKTFLFLLLAVAVLQLTRILPITLCQAGAVACLRLAGIREVKSISTQAPWCITTA
jgi:hypothetical protein